MTISNIHIKQNNKQKDDSAQLEQDTELDAINEVDNENGKQKQNLKLTEQPVKLVSLQTKGKKQIKCCELSPSGELIVYSTDSNIRMLKFEYVSNHSTIIKAKVL